jgi:hypothetical protein
MLRPGTTRTKVMAIAAGTAASLALGAGVVAGLTGANAADNPTATPTATPTPKANGNGPNGLGAPGLRGGPGHRGFGLGLGGDRAALAKELGVSEDKLKTALQNVRDDLRPDKGVRPKAGTRPDPRVLQEKFATALAKELGISSAKVTAALDSLKAEHEAERAKEFEARLDQAVKDGKLTQTEADAVLKAAKAGIIGTGGPRHP